MNKDSPVLLIEDEKITQIMTQEAFKTLNISNPLKIVENGHDAITFLNDPSLDLPCLILLDLHMPLMNGVEFLQIIKSDDILKQIPVAVLTASNTAKDIMDSYELEVTHYFVKPAGHQAFTKLISSLDTYLTYNRQSSPVS
ncbi:MAG: response regulator [Sneathiella sp.]|nr:response regulator [Sneathiella sp.]